MLVKGGIFTNTCTCIENIFSILNALPYLWFSLTRISEMTIWKKWHDHDFISKTILVSNTLKWLTNKCLNPSNNKMRQLMRLSYLSHRRPAKAQASLRIHAVSPEPSLFAHMKYGSRQRVRLKIRHLAPLDGWACAFEEWVYGRRKVP